MNRALLIWRKSLNVVMLTLTGVAAFAVVSVLFLILGYLLWNGGKSLNLAFFTQLPKPVGETGGGMANAIVGSLKLLLLAAVIGLPVGLMAGVYLAEFGGHTFAYIIRYTTDLLNGVPSIVIGIFAYSLAVLPVKHFSTLAGGFALGIMVIPITVRSTEEFLRAVPGSMREGAMALGASKWKTIATVVLPAARGGIITGVLLALARVSGETAPLLFTAFGNRFWSPGWNQPIASLPVMIYTYAVAPYDDWHRQAWAAGLVLLALVLIANVGTRLVLSRGEREVSDIFATTKGNGAAAARLAPQVRISEKAPAIPEKEPLVRFEISHLNFFYGQKQAVYDLSVKIPKNRVTALIGPSGCGKSTFLRTLNRMNETIRNTRVEGQILLDGQDILKMDVVGLRHRVGMVFQRPNPFPKSIFDNVAYGLRINGYKGRLADLVEHSLRRSALWDEVKDYLHKSAFALSGGQQQRLCIARALAVDPEVLLLDEPCSALDPVTTAKIEELMFQLRDSCTMAIVTHNMQQAARASDFTAFMLDGKLIEHNETSKIFTTPSDARTEAYITGRFG